MSLIRSMRADDATLPDDLETAHGQIRELAATLRQQDQLIARLQHQLEQLLRRRYGKSSERIDPDQLLLFAQEILVQAEPTAPPAQPPASKAKAEGHGRQRLPASLPRKRIVHDVPAEDRACPECGARRQKIGEETREQLEYVPASLLVLEHVRPKYACRACAAQVVIAPRLPEPIEKGLPGAGLLAQVAVSKYADHLPLYRQEAIFRRHGVELSRSTLCDWMATAAELLEPLVREMTRRILLSKVVQTDDTPVTVQIPGGPGTKTGRLWTYLGCGANRFIVYDFTPDRSGDGPGRMLGGFTGYLQADAYSAYDRLFASGRIIEVGCWMHARRKFYEARTSDPERSHLVLAWIGQLYKVEEAARKARGEHPEWDDEAWHAHRWSMRQQRSGPIWEAICVWLDAESAKALPKSPLGEAVAYARNHWDALVRPREAGLLELDNGASERALRPVALGRKNWLFCGSDRGGRTAAVLMSLTASCKAFSVEPFAYLRDVLQRVSTHPNSRIAELLPDRWKPAESPDPPDRKA
jgi:transposase